VFARASAWHYVTDRSRAGPWGGQANRVKKSCRDEACEELVVPPRDLAPEAE
jgi:hypothetical protein